MLSRPEFFRKQIMQWSRQLISKLCVQNEISTQRSNDLKENEEQTQQHDGILFLIQQNIRLKLLNILLKVIQGSEANTIHAEEVTLSLEDTITQYSLAAEPVFQATRNHLDYTQEHKQFFVALCICKFIPVLNYILPTHCICMITSITEISETHFSI